MSAADVQLIGISKLEQLLDTSRTTIWRLCSAGKFPKPIYIGARRAWRLADVEAWIASRVEQRDADASFLVRIEEAVQVATAPLRSINAKISKDGAN